MSNLREIYNKELRETLKEELGLNNIMAVPKLTKVVINMGVGEAANDKKHLESALENLTVISGQKPVVTRARQSVASFKIRIPRERDFRGLNPKSFDQQGNYSFGIKEQIIFPEINYDNIDNIRGMDVCINTSAKSQEHAKALLKALDFPFKER